ncbi:MAG: hypothetical protein JJ992_07025 [Planctomycetes bacterium]|nr:hypothetical protein [Planctomycetota bacterium]
MFHKSELGEHARHFPHDLAGYVPVETDSWRQMKFDHAGMDPDEEGLSQEERARREEYLDKVWWPRLLASVHEQRLRLEQEHGESFVKHWQRIVNQEPPQPRSFVVE